MRRIAKIRRGDGHRGFKPFYGKHRAAFHEKRGTLSYMVVIISLVVLLGIFHLKGIQGLYDTVPHYDDFLHIAGGVVAALIVRQILTVLKMKMRWFRVIVWVLFIGIVWEASEYIWDLTIAPYYGLSPLQRGMGDTIFDILNDIIGAGLAVIVYFFREEKAGEKA